MSKQYGNDNIINNFELKKPNKYLVLILSILLVLILGITDYISGYEMSFSIFYLIPISIAVFLTDFKFGLIISILSTISWHLADIYSGHIYLNILIPFWNSIVRFGYFILHSFLFSQFIKSYEKTKINSLSDSLTGTINTRFFYELFNRELKKAKRTNLAFTLVYIDLDNFKSINDTYGHQYGDSLLKLVSSLIIKNIRPSDIFARLGGDEFALLLPETDHYSFDLVIKRIRAIIETELKKNNFPVTLSIGAITFKIFNSTIDEMIKQADELMYNVKRKGKNNIEHYLCE